MIGKNMIKEYLKSRQNYNTTLKINSADGMKNKGNNRNNKNKMKYNKEMFKKKIMNFLKTSNEEMKDNKIYLLRKKIISNTNEKKSLIRTNTNQANKKSKRIIK